MIVAVRTVWREVGWACAMLGIAAVARAQPGPDAGLSGDAGSWGQPDGGVQVDSGVGPDAQPDVAAESPDPELPLEGQPSADPPAPAPAEASKPYESPSDAVGWGDADSDAAGFESASDAVGFGSASDAVGFGSEVPAPVSDPVPAPSAWSGKGFVRSDGAAWLERFSGNPVAKLRQSADLALRYRKGGLRLHFAAHYERDFAYLVGRDDYDAATLRDYEEQLRLRETFVGYGVGPLEISTGFQIIAWGQGDVVSLVDVVNPRDLREPGLADLDDLRMPVLSTVVGLFLGDHRVEGMILHEAFFGLRSSPYGPFSPFAQIFQGDGSSVAGMDLGAVLADAELRYRHEPKRYAARNQQYLARWAYKGPGLDAALYVASVLDQLGVVRGVTTRSTQRVQIPFPANALEAPVTQPLAMEVNLDHPRYTLLGHSGALPAGDFVFKWELAAQIDRAVNVGDPADPSRLSVDRSRTLGALLGVAYSGLPDTTIFVEYGQSWLLRELSAEPLFPVEAPSLALRSQTHFLKERLQFSVAGTMWGWLAQYGGLVRAELNYTVRDGLKIGGGFITYQPSKRVGPLFGFTQHDRAYLQLRYDFSLAPG